MVSHFFYEIHQIYQTKHFVIIIYQRLCIANRNDIKIQNINQFCCFRCFSLYRFEFINLINKKIKHESWRRYNKCTKKAWQKTVILSEAITSSHPTQRLNIIKNVTAKDDNEHVHVNEINNIHCPLSISGCVVTQNCTTLEALEAGSSGSVHKKSWNWNQNIMICSYAVYFTVFLNWNYLVVGWQ